MRAVLNRAAGRTALWLSAALALAGPSALDAAEPASVMNLSYRHIGERSLGLDLFLPAETDHPAPLIVLIHGGGWNAGRKEDYAGVARDFAAHGYAAAAVEYRLAKEAPFPAQIEDVKAAIRWLRAHAGEYRLDPDHIAAMGHSAGGHLAALVGTSSRVARFDTGENLEFSSRVQAVVDLAGPVDLVTYFAPAPGKPSPRVPLFGGTLDQKRSLALLASPVTHIDNHTPPFLIISGMQDTLVPLVQPELMYASLQHAGIPCQLMLIPGLSHGINLHLPYGKGRLFDAIYFFLNPILSGGRGFAGPPAESPPPPVRR